MYDMDKCEDYVPMEIREMNDLIIGAIRIDQRVWVLALQVEGLYIEWVNAGAGWQHWDKVNRLIDRHYLQLEHGKETKAKALSVGVL